VVYLHNKEHHLFSSFASTIMSNSVRHLYTRNARKVLGLPSHTKHLLQDAGEDTPANPGDMIMNSFFAPALDADTTYTISATQTDITIVPPDGGNSYKAPDIIRIPRYSRYQHRNGLSNLVISILYTQHRRSRSIQISSHMLSSMIRICRGSVAVDTAPPSPIH
jgi:hypothetical protein